MFAGQEIESKGGKAFGSGTDIHSSAGMQTSPDGSSPCLALVFSMAPKGTHDGLCLCNTRLNRAKQEGTLCHLFQRAVDMVCFLPGW